MKKIPKSIPTWIFILAIALTLSSAVYAVLTVTTRTYSTLFGEIIDVTEDLTVVSKGINIEPTTRSAITNVTLASPLATGRTALTKGDYSYTVEVTIAILSANQKYNCSLYQEQSGNWVYMNSLYVLQSGSPSIGHGAKLTWDVGASLQSSVYKLVIQPY